jgi:hypothetical protein
MQSIILIRLLRIGIKKELKRVWSKKLVFQLIIFTVLET